jgi:hypothetical protein
MSLLCINASNQECEPLVEEGELYHPSGHKIIDGVKMYVLSEFGDQHVFFTWRFVPFEYPVIEVLETEVLSTNL